MTSNVVIKQHKSAAGADRPQRDTLRTLGLGRIGNTSERADGPALRGLLRRVAHLVTVEERSNG